MVPIRLVSGLLASMPLLAQNTLFLEAFDAGLPASWQHQVLGLGADTWLTARNPASGSVDAYHEYFCTNGTLLRDNRLVTPEIDLRGLAAAQLQWDDTQVLASWRLRNTVEVSVAGGPFTTVYSITRTTNGLVQEVVDLAAFVGQSRVRVGFRYVGDIANEWRIDNVRVTTAQPVLAVRDLAGGATSTFTVVGVAPGGAAIIGVSFGGGGPLPTTFGDVLLTQPLFALPILLGGGSGSASLPVAIPAAGSGLRLWAHSVELPPGGAVNFTNAISALVR